MINGVFHNGPLSTIRFVGGVGLAFYYVMIFVMALQAVRLIHKTRGTILFPAALFISMPILYYAAYYPFGAGQFDLDFPQYLFTAGVIKLLRRACLSLPEAMPQGGTPLQKEPMTAPEFRPVLAPAAGFARRTTQAPGSTLAP